MLKVLIFESDHSFAVELRTKLSQFGCSVQVFKDGNTGIMAAVASRPDLILVSVELPRLNGFSVCNRIKRDAELRPVPLIIMSRHATPETFEQHRQLAMRAEDYVHKPIDFESLLARIEQFVAIRGAQPERGARAMPTGDARPGSAPRSSQREWIPGQATAAPGPEQSRPLDLGLGEGIAAGDAAELPVNLGAVTKSALRAHGDDAQVDAEPPSEPAFLQYGLGEDDEDEATQVVELDDLNVMDQVPSKPPAPEPPAPKPPAVSPPAVSPPAVVSSFTPTSPPIAFSPPSPSLRENTEIIRARESLQQKDKENLQLREDMARSQRELIAVREVALKAEREMAQLHEQINETRAHQNQATDRVEAMEAERALVEKRVQEFTQRSERLTEDVQQRTRELRAAQQAHGQALEEIRREFEQTQKNEEEQRRQQGVEREKNHQTTLDNLTRQAEEAAQSVRVAHAEALARRTDELGEQLAKANQEAQRDRVRVVEQNTAVLAQAEASQLESSTEISRLGEGLRQAQAQQEQLEVQHQDKLAQWRGQHQEELATLTSKHETESGLFREQLDRRVKELRDQQSAQVDRIEALRADDIERREQQLQEVTGELTRRRQQQVERLEQENREQVQQLIQEQELAAQEREEAQEREVVRKDEEHQLALEDQRQRMIQIAEEEKQQLHLGFEAEKLQRIENFEEEKQHIVQSSGEERERLEQAIQAEREQLAQTLALEREQLAQGVEAEKQRLVGEFEAERAKRDQAHQAAIQAVTAQLEEKAKEAEVRYARLADELHDELQVAREMKSGLAHKLAAVERARETLSTVMSQLGESSSEDVAD